MKKILFLGQGSSIHMQRWVNAIADRGFEVIFASQHDFLEPLNSNVLYSKLPYSGGKGYFLNANPLKKLLKKHKPDIVNVHYASGYATTMRLAKARIPYILSVWGADVYDFPLKSPIHLWWLRGNLMAASKITSTSHVMAAQTKKVAPYLDEIAIVPFGVDLEKFKNNKKENDIIIIGTIKTLAPKYGIDTLIEAFALLINSRITKLKLRIIGTGSHLIELVNLVEKLKITEYVEFSGLVPHHKIPEELSKMDIFVALSRLDSESFGVAVIEAGACGLPVVVSDAGGLPEVVKHHVTGIIVPRENPQAATDALELLILNHDLRKSMGENGRNHVSSLYNWNDNVNQMIEVFKSALKI